jgi:hypothetical protein
VSWVGVQAAICNWPAAQGAQATHVVPTRWYPGMQALQVVAPLQAAQPAGQGRQDVFAFDVQGAARYWPAPQVVQAWHTTPSPVKPA